MRFVDTNIFLRYLTKDDPVKAQACFDLFLRAERNEVALYTTETIVAEIVYILSSKRLYNLTHQAIRERLVPLLSIPGLKLPNRGVHLRALELYAEYPVDYEDALAVAHMETKGIHTIYSYDRDFDRFAHIERMEP